MLRNRRLASREKRVSFRVSPEEYAALEAAATAAGLTVSAFVRGALPALLSETGRRRTRPRTTGPALPVVLTLTRIARTLEALRQWVTGQPGRLSPAEVVALRAHLVAVEGVLAQVATSPPGEESAP